MRIDASGNVGIGTMAPEARLDVKTTLAITEEPVANANSELFLYSRFSDSQRGFVTLRCESLSSGSSDLVFRTRNNYIDGERVRIDSSGNMSVTGTITESSSITYKENVDPITNALELVTQLVGVTYDRKDGSAKDRAGLIAEQVNEVLPNVVKKNEEGGAEAIAYTNLIAYLIESVKELKSEIDELRGK